MNSGQLRVQRYYNFKGVDFTDNYTAETRSPDAINMWKNYRTLGKLIETRPDVELQLTLSNTIFGLFFYEVSNVEHWIIHTGVSLIDYEPITKVKKVIKATGMKPSKSSAFIYNNIFYIIDGINYLEYDGATLKEVAGYVPLTSIARKPKGGGTQYQDINLLSPYRKNGFWGDGESTIYYLDSQNIDDVTNVWINDILQEKSTYTVDKLGGSVTFTTAPEKTNDEDNVVIEYKKEISGYENKLKKCTLTAVFDNRVFFSGNQDYPNAVFWCGYNNPRYISDMNYALEGTDLAKVKALVPGNNALWVFKESSQANTTVFYHAPLEVFDNRLNDTVKTYPSTHSSISTGCSAAGINFADDIVFFSDRGMEGISGDITTEQFLGHRSTLVDTKLLNETNYKDMTLAEWEGYLFVVIDNKVYLADSRQKATNNDHIEYEWFYWDFDIDFKYATEKNNTLYLCSKEHNVKNENGYIKYIDNTNTYWYDPVNQKLYDDEGALSNVSVSTLTEYKESGIYTLTNNSEDRKVKSYWVTPEENYGNPQMLKTTNKRGFKSDVDGSEITIEVRTDNNEFSKLGTYKNTKGYIVAKLKRKKWSKIQLKYVSDKPFGIYGITLESYIGSYVKR